MNADAREAAILLMLEFERERVRLCREALQQSPSPELARAWAMLVHDGELRAGKLASACRDLAIDPTSRPSTSLAAGLASALVAELQQAMHRAASAPAAKMAASTSGTAAASAEAWELRVG
jgi:hypothetical protein